MPPKKKAEPSRKRKAESAVPASAASTKKAKAGQTSFPGNISKNLTISQLREEAEARGLELGNVKHDKAFFLEVLGEGSVSVVSLGRKQTILSSKSTKAKDSSNSGSKISSPTPPKPKLTKPGKASPAPTKPKPTKTGNAKSGEVKAKATPTKTKANATSSGKATGKLTTGKSEKPKSPAASSSIKKAKTAVVKKDPQGPSSSQKQKPTARLLPVTVSSGGLKTATATTNARSLVTKPVKVASSMASVTTKSAKVITTKPKKNATTTALPRDATASSEDFPRISSKLTFNQLKEEVIARQIDPKTGPKSKAGLLHFLVEGSIHVKETDTYKVYQNLLKKVEGQKAKLYQQSMENREANEAKKEALRMEKFEKGEKKRQEEEKRCLQLREEEIARQKPLHSYCFPQVHCHPLAKTNCIVANGKPRREWCGLCDRRRGSSGFLRVCLEDPNPAEFTCEECDWDICLHCFNLENRTDAEKKKTRMEYEKKQKAERRQREEEQHAQEMEEQNRWDAKKRFKANTIIPPAKHKNASSKLKYIVWCSDGYGNDGWHSYEGEPTKEFDSIWASKKEANERAEYLFYWKNPWGTAPNEVGDDDGDPLPVSNSGMNKWTVSPPDSTRWTVGVVPTEAYLHLENASQQRHNFDDEREPTGYECTSNLCY